MLAFLVLLLVAGNETTTNLIGTAIRQLAEDPPLMRASATTGRSSGT